LTVAAAVACTALACSEPVNYPTRVVHRAVGMAVTCADADWKAVPIADCTTSGKRAVAWIADADLGSVAIMDASEGSHVDSDRFVPGFTSLRLSDDPKVLVDPVAIRGQPDSKAVYVLLRQQAEVVRLGTEGLPSDLASLSLTRQDLPCEAVSIDVAWTGPLAPALVVVCPDPGADPAKEPAGLLVLPLADPDPANAFGKLDPATVRRIHVPGRPYLLTISPDGAYAYVTQHPVPRAGEAIVGRYLSRVDLETGDIAQAGVVAECSDGLDNRDAEAGLDGRATGCTGPDDPTETHDDQRPCKPSAGAGGSTFDCQAATGSFVLDPSPRCFNGVDDDGDGLTDLDDPDCYGPSWNDEHGGPDPLVGRPAVSPDGAWIYVPMGQPDQVRVFRKEPFEALDVTAAGGTDPNPLLARLGVRDVPVPGPATSVIMTTTADGARALVILGSGDLFELVVDDHGTPKHGYATFEDVTLRSDATAPQLFADGLLVDRSAALHPEYPGLGPMGVALVSGTTDKYSYYGITFGEDLQRQLGETWTVAYEGVIPGAESEWGFLAGDGTIEDPIADFCADGVEAGDHVVLRPAAISACSGVDLPVLEYGVAGVGRTALDLVALPGGAPLPAAGCLDRATPYEVRTAASWTVVGSRSGFLHNWKASGEACVLRDAADPAFDAAYRARAVTSLPREGDGLQACPPVVDETDIDWVAFDNGALSFRIFPACKTDETFASSVLPSRRDTEMRFRVHAGLTSRAINVGSLPLEPVVAGTTAWVFDAGGGYVATVDLVELTITASHY
jgi:hypothetical protein